MNRLPKFFTFVPALLVNAVWGLLFTSLTASADVVEVRPALIENGDSLGIEYRSGTELVGRSTDAAPAGVELRLPDDGSVPVLFQKKTERAGVIELGPAQVGSLTLRWRIVQKTPSLVERTLEIVHVPAFNESIRTVTGQPHGHILYSWNSGYWWLRKEIRRRLGQTGPDPVGAAMDARLGVVRENGVLRLER